MNRILLTSTALVAFAGAAAADGHASVSFGGEAKLGANTTAGVNDAETTSFYWSGDLSVTATAALDNGLTATAKFGLDIVSDSVANQNVTSNGFSVGIASETAGLTFGEIENVAEDNFTKVDGSEVGFTEAADDQAVLAGYATFAGFKTQASFQTTAANDGLEAMQIHVGGAFGAVNVELGYEDNGGDGVTGVSASSTFAGATVTASYITNGTETSTGVGLKYPFGPVTADAYYTMNDVAEDNYGGGIVYEANGIKVDAGYDFKGSTDVGSYAIEGSYVVGNGITAYAGVLGSDATGANTTYYVAGTYDLGGGASVLMSYADDGDSTAAGSDLGDPEYKEGLTVEVSFKF